MRRRILITGSESYIGTSFAKWLARWPDKYETETIDMRGGAWRDASFGGYDAVFHVAGIAHVSADPRLKEKYYAVNRDLAAAAAEKAKRDGAKQFIFMSSMIIYGNGNSGEDFIITKATKPAPTDFYGDSKLQADIAIRALADNSLTISIMRPPVIYGPGCKGNFPKLIKMAKKALTFPDIYNRHSMLYIDNLCEFLRGVIDDRRGGVFFPQDAEYIATRDVITEYRQLLGKRTLLVAVPDFVKKRLLQIPIFNKAFGTKIYARELSEDGAYQAVGLRTALERMKDAEERG